MSAVALFHFLTLAFRNQWATCRHVALKGRGKLLAPKEFDPPTFLAAGFSLSDFSAFHYRDVSSFPSAISVPFPSRRAILAQNLWRSSSSRHPGDLPSCSSPFCWLLLLLPQTSLIAACLLSSDPLPQLQAWSRPRWVFPALLSSPPSGIFYASKCPEGALHIQRPFRPLSVFQVLPPSSSTLPTLLPAWCLQALRPWLQVLVQASPGLQSSSSFLWLLLPPSSMLPALLGVFRIWTSTSFFLLLHQQAKTWSQLAQERTRGSKSSF